LGDNPGVWDTAGVKCKRAGEAVAVKRINTIVDGAGPIRERDACHRPVAGDGVIEVAMKAIHCGSIVNVADGGEV
jgi:hypothetical protein